MGLTQILEALSTDPHVTDVRCAAYMLATVKHECADVWHPIEEFGKGRGLPYGVPVTVTDAAGNQYTNTYYGRGYVQLTWKNNYAKMSTALNMGDDLLCHPEKALSSDVAYQIMSYGMRNGSFTGRGLSSFFGPNACDYLNAREIINGHDCCDKIADYAKNLEDMLSASIH